MGRDRGPAFGRVVGLGWRATQSELLFANQLFNQVLDLPRDLGLGGEFEGLAPIDDLESGGVARFGDEGRVPIEHLKHDHTQGPPIASSVITCASKDLGRHIVVGANDREGHLFTIPVAPGEDGLVRGGSTNRLRILFIVKIEGQGCGRLGVVVSDLFAGLERVRVLNVDTGLSQKGPSLGLVVGCVVRPVEIGGETKVGQLDVTLLVEQKVVRLDQRREHVE